MAEITSAAAGSKPGGRRGKKLSTRVDLTPMVDLGFLLITFFIFTTTLSEPSAVILVMPADGGESMPTKESGSLTVIPLANNRIFYYHGRLQEPMPAGSSGIVGYSYADGIGKVIRDKQQFMELKKPMSARELMLIIKPTNSASYQNVVDILDEVTINDVKSYALTDISIAEIRMLETRKLN
jgi:biopolymer transport protein ExbD